MFAYPLRTAALAAAAIVGLSACTTPYGYGGVSVGANNGYYDPYYGGYGYGGGYPSTGYGYGAGYPGSGYGYGGGYPGYGYGYGAGYPGYGYGYQPYWGWNDNFYYPGTGLYVYDTYRRPHRWTDAQQRYWTALRDRAVATSTTSTPVVVRENWNDFDRTRVRARPNRDKQSVERPARIERIRPERVDRQVQVEQSVERPARIERVRPERVDRQVQVESNRSVVRTERPARQERVERNVVRAEAKERSAVRAERRSEARSSQALTSEERSDGRRRGRDRSADE
jgi:hypothetical protein